MYALELILLIYFSYVSLYSFILSVGGLFYKNEKIPESIYKRKIAILIPAYREDGVIVAVARQALKQNYPHDKFDVVIIADSLSPVTLEHLRALPIILIEVAFSKSTKVKALNRAMQFIGDDYDCAVILDADNVMEANFISKINNLMTMGYKAIQGRRDAKNKNTSMAVLDGLSEAINNFIYRQGTVALGMSASLNGSGMAFEYGVYKKIMAGMDSIGGFDRELELKLIERNTKVYFARNAVIYDEKVSNTKIFEKQRRRWISSQFFYLKKYFSPGILQLFKGNFTFFNSAVLRNIQLPRVLNLGLLTFFSALSLLFSQYFSFSPFIWLSLWGLSILSVVYGIPPKFYSLKLLKSVLLVPVIFVKMFLLLFKLKGANKSFIHTPHGNIEPQPSNAEKV